MPKVQWEYIGKRDTANKQYRHSSISAVSISMIFDLTRFIIFLPFSTTKYGTIQVLRHHVFFTFLGPPTHLFDDLQCVSYFYTPLDFCGKSE